MDLPKARQLKAVQNILILIAYDQITRGGTKIRREEHLILIATAIKLRGGASEDVER